VPRPRAVSLLSSRASPSERVATRYTIAGGKWSDVAEIVVTGPGMDSVPPTPDLLSL
jgi:hypothetical protein